MSTPNTPLTQTPARRNTLQDVVLGLVSYNPLLGQYLKGGKQVPGPQGRTLREDFRGGGYIEPGSATAVAKVALTESGKQLAADWKLTNAAQATE